MKDSTSHCVTRLDNMSRSYSGWTEIVRLWESFYFEPTCGNPKWNRRQIEEFEERLQGKIEGMIDNWNEKIHRKIRGGKNLYLEDVLDLPLAALTRMKRFGRYDSTCQE